MAKFDHPSPNKKTQRLRSLRFGPSYLNSRLEDLFWTGGGDMLVNLGVGRSFWALGGTFKRFFAYFPGKVHKLEFWWGLWRISLRYGCQVICGKRRLDHHALTRLQTTFRIVINRPLVSWTHSSHKKSNSISPYLCRSFQASNLQFCCKLLCWKSTLSPLSLSIVY